MEKFEIRLIAECEELKAKLDKLNDFLETEQFEKLSAHNKSLLILQKVSMTYLCCLNERIALIGAE